MPVAVREADAHDRKGTPKVIESLSREFPRLLAILDNLLSLDKSLTLGRAKRACLCSRLLAIFGRLEQARSALS